MAKSQAHAVWHVLDPSGDMLPDRAIPQHKLAPPVQSLNGKTLGFLSNMWPSVGPIFRRLQEIAGQRYQLAGAVTKERALTSAPAPKAMLDELATRTDAVIVAPKKERP